MNLFITWSLYNLSVYIEIISLVNRNGIPFAWCSHWSGLNFITVLYFIPNHILSSTTTLNLSFFVLSHFLLLSLILSEKLKCLLRDYTVRSTVQIVLKSLKFFLINVFINVWIVEKNYVYFYPSVWIQILESMINGSSLWCQNFFYFFFQFKFINLNEFNVLATKKDQF